MQLAEVANARLQEAMRTLQSQQGMMKKIKLGTDSLQLFMNVGETVSEVRDDTDPRSFFSHNHANSSTIFLIWS